MGNVALNVDSTNAASLGGIPATELRRLAYSVTGGPTCVNADGSEGVPWTSLDAAYGDTKLRAQIDAQLGFF